MIKECKELPLPYGRNRTTSAKLDIDEFLNSDMKICEVDISGCKDAGTAYNRYEYYAWRDERFKLCCRSGKLFMVKTDEG